MGQDVTNVELIPADDPGAEARLLNLEAAGVVKRRLDALPDMLEDWFRHLYPHVGPGSPEYGVSYDRFRSRWWTDAQVATSGVWAIIPWRNAAVHLPSEDVFFALRTSRNRYLVTTEEQRAFHDALVGVGGLSVGSSVVTTMVMSGGPGHLRIGDSDHLGVTNLNRLAGSVCDLGESKADLCARRVLEMNPFQTLDVFDKGLVENELDGFFGDGAERLDLFIEEMDDIRMKALSRFMARERGVPVVMATDNGDNAIVDVERFDLEPDRPLFHGAVSEEDLRAIPARTTLPERVRLAGSIVGRDITPRTQISLQMVSNRLPAWPQLGTAAALSGVVATYVARRILTGASMPSGRYHVSVDRSLDPDYASEKATSERASTTAEYVSNLKLLFDVDV
jgi:tRNA threonylcarbamoyladenosine dehydratase